MNARQKAKKYKKECERLKSIMSTTKVQPYIVNQHSIVTLRAEQLVDLAEIQYGYSDETLIRATMKVVDMHREG